MGAQKNGFRDCWQNLADPDPHILDLYRVDLLGGKNRDMVAELAAKGLARLSDVPTELLSGASATRQRLQIECTATRREYIDPGLSDLLSKHPYATLPPLPIGHDEEVVREGTGAMRVYQEMMFGRASQDPNARTNYRKLLLQYCKLDTAAMVAIWMHWTNADHNLKGDLPT